MRASTSTLAARPGLVAEMEQHLRGSDEDLRRAAEGMLSVVADERLAAALIDPALDRWVRLAACEAVAGARIEAMLRAIARDAKEEATLRAAAEDVLGAMKERGKLLRPTERRPEEEHRTLLRPAWHPPSEDTSKLVRPVEEAIVADERLKKRRLRLWRRKT